MKMKKIAAILTALSVFSGCAGNVATEEATTTTGTTEAVMVETTTTATEVVTEAENTEVAETTSTTERDTGWHEAGENGMPAFNPDDFAHLITEDENEYPPIPVISEENETNSVVVDEVVKHIELITLPRVTDYTEFYCLALLYSHVGIISMDSDMRGYLSGCYGENPSINYVEDWGCYPETIINAFRNSDSSFRKFFKNLTNSSPEELYEYIDNNIPVMVWVTEGLAEPELFSEYEGNKMYNPKECVVLAGYTDTAVCVWSVIEEKYVTYDRALFEQRYKEMGSMALAIALVWSVIEGKYVPYNLALIE